MEILSLIMGWAWNVLQGFCAGFILFQLYKHWKGESMDPEIIRRSDNLERRMAVLMQDNEGIKDRLDMIQSDYNQLRNNYEYLKEKIRYEVFRGDK